MTRLRRFVRGKNRLMMMTEICRDFRNKTLSLIRNFVFFFVPSGSELSKQLDNWLSAADLTYGPARAIIAP
jgi:hypothetical protein